ncbi:MAG: hypothetical protein LBP22_17360 [Deltaproteobacteria bacterium]|nr:hypothetical protein [Deltaproteobacteria bacterium]
MGRTITAAALGLTLPGRHQVRTVSFGAAVGTATLGVVARPSGAATRRTTATTASASAWP